MNRSLARISALLDASLIALLPLIFVSSLVLH
jgi:hypothetical protein